MNISIVGSGYVGLVSGTCFAETGNQVVCVDKDEDKISRLQNGILPIYEPGLALLLERNVRESRLRFSTSLERSIRDSDAIFLALPTPPGEDGAADLQYVLDVAGQLSQLITRYTVIVNKSTVPAGTAARVTEVMLRGGLARELFDVVSNPEFLREGIAVEDFLKPDRVVIGSSSERAKAVMNELYQPYVRQGNPILFMDECSAEMTKYAANAYLAMRISFMNEMANLCERTGADVDNVRIGIGSDTRIGKRFLFPGIGYGGSCFPKDVKALAHIAASSGACFELVETVMMVNERQKERIGDKILNYYGEDLSGKTFAIWGLSFKPETDDIREAPSLSIIEGLKSRGAAIRAFDPEAMEHVRKTAAGEDVYFAVDQYDALQGADALIIVTEWNEFRMPDFGKIKSLLSEPVIFDGRNLYSLDKMETTGFYYESIGRRIIGKYQFGDAVTNGALEMSGQV